MSSVSLETASVSLKINGKKILNINDLLPSELSGKNIDEYLYNEVIDILKNQEKIRYVKTKNKENFLIYFNSCRDTLLYKLVDFNNIIFNTYKNILKDKTYNRFKINWDCSFGKKIIDKFYLVDIYNLYNEYINGKNKNEFLFILNKSMQVWDKVYIYYLNLDCYCDINSNSTSNLIIEKHFNSLNLPTMKEFKNNKLLEINSDNNENNSEKENDLNIKNRNIEFDVNIDSEIYVMIFQYVEVVQNEENTDFVFNFDFLKKYSYPDTVIKNENDIYEVELKDHKDFNILGWYKDNSYFTDKNKIKEIIYSKNINIKIDDNLYIYVLYENI